METDEAEITSLAKQMCLAFAGNDGRKTVCIRFPCRDCKAAATIADTRARGAAEDMREALEAIKGMVCGERNPFWADPDKVTNSRAVIADLIDLALPPKEPGPDAR